ncbi:hypothetical protein BC833DRAFT_611084 [Globomyces pollinis-pini]|nr:hypothetical protein BC833DRAFT_611084 [Globomyces pollinis-pini]
MFLTIDNYAHCFIQFKSPLDSSQFHSTIVMNFDVDTIKVTPTRSKDVLNTLMVEHLSKKFDSKALLSYFAQFGDIQEIRIPSTKLISNKPFYRCHVQFENSADAQKALIQLNGFPIRKSYLVVEYDSQRQKCS